MMLPAEAKKWPGRSVAGVYLLIRRGEVVYIGQSGDLKQRMCITKIEYDDIMVIHCKCHLKRSRLERYYISMFRPQHNVKSNPDRQNNSRLLHPDRLERIDALLGRASDRKIAIAFGIDLVEVRNRREFLGLPKTRSKRS